MGVPLDAAPLAYALMLIIPLISIYAFRDNAFAEANMFTVGPILKKNQYHRMVTAAFLHGDPGHLLVNMLTYFFFAPVVEAIYGTAGFALLFFGAAIGANILTLYLKRTQADYRAVGASGAISGILLAFCVYAPMDLIYVFFAIPVPAIVFAALYIAYSTFAMGGAGRVAHEAHLGGALTGAALAFLMVPSG